VKESEAGAQEFADAMAYIEQLKKMAVENQQLEAKLAEYQNHLPELEVVMPPPDVKDA
jgi:chaperonin cofactor prefoldin